MKKSLKSNIFITLIAIGCLWFSLTPTAHDFATLQHHLDLRGVRILINSVHDEHWDIGYYLGEDCPPERRAETKELEDAITLALQTWLQPLREIDTEALIVNEFRFQHFHEPIAHELLKKIDIDLGVIDLCVEGRSSAGFLPNLPPRVFIRTGGNINAEYIYALIHEIGHAFGLGDLYAERPMAPSVTKGGLDATVGTQPAAVMAMWVYNHTGDHLTEDDRNGIIWLYKAIYEDLDPANCLYPNYVLEKDPLGCVPKSPLIFEIRQGHELYTLEVLKEDENIDVNAQDDTGSTALHYAVKGGHVDVIKGIADPLPGENYPGLLSRADINVNFRDESGSTPLHYAIIKGNPEILDALLSHDDIWVHPKNKAGKTPIGLARDLGDKALMDRLAKHPNYQLNVTPKGKLATKWASLKQR